MTMDAKERKRIEALQKVAVAWNRDIECYICGDRRDLEIDHIDIENCGENDIKKYSGGSDVSYDVVNNTPFDEVKNKFILLCHKHNREKNALVCKLYRLAKEKKQKEFMELLNRSDLPDFLIIPPLKNLANRNGVYWLNDWI